MYTASTFFIRGLSPEFCKSLIDKGLGHYWEPELVYDIDKIRIKPIDIAFLFKNDIINKENK